MVNTDCVSSDSAAPLIALRVEFESGPSKLIVVDHDEFTIGSADRCDLCLSNASIPHRHSLLHVQGPVIWIEAIDENAAVTVNHEDFRRRALRDGDRLTFGAVEATVHLGEASVRAARRTPRDHGEREDLSQLSAEELCDRIEQEESLAQDYDRRRSFGWRALMTAVEEMIHQRTESSGEEAAAVAEEKFEELVAQVRDLSESLDERTKTLAAQEAMLLESSAQLTDAQHRVSRQMEQLLERLSASEDQRGELRVSA